MTKRHLKMTKNMMYYNIEIMLFHLFPNTAVLKYDRSFFKWKVSFNFT